jgi:hypothetical protein
MTVELKDTRKVAVIGWDTALVLGNDATLHAGGEEKRNVKNDGESNLFFPMDFVGDVEVTVVGSSSGEDTGTISVE